LPNSIVASLENERKYIVSAHEIFAYFDLSRIYIEYILRIHDDY
jgi:hypothetical protein